MALTCNIDRRGRRWRAAAGTMLLAIGGLLAGFGAAQGSTARTLLGVALGLVGLFQWYEARKGWCVLRAMGVRTPI